MEKSKVYFTNFRTRGSENLLQKLQRLIKTAGIGNIDFNGKFTAIKIHFGEPGNIAYLRPNWAKAVADVVKDLGGIPFLTDCNTLYPGKRKNAIEHLEAAYTNGFNPFSTGCQIIIADGLKGTDEAYVPFPEGEYVKEAKVGQALMDADILISLSHFKLHEAAGVGGAIKNIGMGGGSRAGKMEQHNAGKPAINEDLCIGCGTCARACAQDAIRFYDAAGKSSGMDNKACSTDEADKIPGKGKKAKINYDKCVGCGRCIGSCNQDATYPVDDNSNELLNRKMAEYAAAIVKDRPQFHISLIVDVSPFCDCYALNDAPVIPDVGMFASFDAVALDQACADAMLKQPILPNTIMDNIKIVNKDPSMSLHVGTDWRVQLEQAEKVGMGTRQYELIEV